MATVPKLIPIRPAKDSPLTPEMKEFIDHAIVPVLVTQYLSEIDAQETSLRKAATMRHTVSEHTAAPELRTMRP